MKLKKKNDLFSMEKKKLNKKIALELKGVSKVYAFRHDKPTFIEQFLKHGESKKFVALNNINLTIYKGEKVGIIGKNGAGKTTFLKIVAGITTPTMGSVVTNGKIVSLIDLTAGFHPELSGYENIFLNGLIIGMSKDEISEKVNDIISFAGLEEFIYAPVYTYSEGMKLRLGFSVAIYADPDILILDEGIAAGDLDFQKKSGEKIEEMFKEDKTIIVVSHWMEYLKNHCNRIILFEKSNIIQDGKIKVIEDYVNKQRAV